MKISTRLSYIDKSMAVCEVTVQNTDQSIIVYASATQLESSVYPDLAQKRAVELAFLFLEKGKDAFTDVSYIKSDHAGFTDSADLSKQNQLRSTPMDDSIDIGKSNLTNSKEDDDSQSQTVEQDLSDAPPW